MFGLKCVVLVAVALVPPSRSDFMSDNTRLINDLTDDYSPLTRPVLDRTSNIEVALGLSLLSVQDVDVERSVMTSSGWLHHTWNDEYLVWDPPSYSNIETVRLPSDRIWTPDVYIFNDADGNYIKMLHDNSPQILLEATGSVHWVVPLTFRTVCSKPEFNATHTIMNCPVKMGSWTYHAGLLDAKMESENADLTHYNGGTEWTLEGAPAVRHEVIYDCCPEPYVDITYEIKMTKHN